MHQQYQEQIIGDLINAIFQGFFNRKLLKQQQTITGSGIIIDDEFNFMFSQWKNSNLNGYTFIRTTTDHLIYGFFEKQLPKGILAIHLKPYKIYIMRCSLKNKKFQWFRDGLVLDQTNNLLYVIELSKRQLNQPVNIGRTQRLSIESFRNDPFKVHWKVKIEERCQLKLDGSLIGISKFLRKKQNKLPSFSGHYQPREINIINLFYSFFGQLFTCPSIIDPKLFLKEISDNNNQICLKQIKQYQDRKQDIYFVSLIQKKNMINTDKKLGILINMTHNYVISLGHYDFKMNLSGLGIQYRKNGQSYVGIFKQNLLIKQYRYNSNSSAKSIVTFQIRQLLAQQHLKSLNYVHNCLYIAQICNFIDISHKIIKYIQAFQKQFQKRNLNYNDSLHFNSSNSTLMNIDKYAIHQKDRFQTATKNFKVETIQNQSSRQIKKPGFIHVRSNSKSIEKEQTLRNSVSPLKGYIIKTQRSPLKQAYMKGKIYKNPLNQDINFGKGKLQKKMNIQ